MDITVLNEVLQNVSPTIESAIVGGITWDILKKSGKTIIQSFKDRYLSNKYFMSEEKCEEFLELILERNGRYKDPLDDIEELYNEVSGADNAEFRNDFKNWIEENIEEFAKLQNSQTNNATFNIGTQINNGSGNINNANVMNFN